MRNQQQQLAHQNGSIWGVLLGMFIGGLAGAIAMLLLAPQSGEDTRLQIKEKGIELRDRTGEILEDAMTEMRQDRNEITTGARLKAKELLQQGQALAAQQLDRVSEAALAGKKVLQSS